MSKENLTNKQVKSFQNEIKKFRENADTWFNNEYATANDKLYGMFAELYSIYEKCVDTEIEANKEKQSWLKDECAKRGIVFKRKNPTLQQLLVKYAFSVDGQNCDKRISAYARVFTIATQLEDVNSGNIAQWIKDEGGIEEIRQNSSSSGIDAEMRIFEGELEVKSKKTLFLQGTDETKKYATFKKGQVVLMVGILEASGKVAIKDTVFLEEKVGKKKITGRTAINAALSNIYSKAKAQSEYEQETEKKEIEARAQRLANEIMKKELDKERNADDVMANASFADRQSMSEAMVA